MANMISEDLNQPLLLVNGSGSKFYFHFDSLLKGEFFSSREDPISVGLFSPGQQTWSQKLFPV